MTDFYEPELGQALFGQPYSEFPCPTFVTAGLEHLALEIERVEGNRRQEQYDAPTGNNAGHYATDVFKMHAYYWGECTCGADDHEDDRPHAAECPTTRPNFRCGDFEVRWYKWCGRGMSMNRRISADEFAEMMERCLESVRTRDVD